MDVDIEDVVRIKKHPIDKRKKMYLKYMTNRTYSSAEEFNKIFKKAARYFRVSISKCELYNKAIDENINNKSFKNYCITHSSRSHSGVCVISTMMAPEMHFKINKTTYNKKFTCKYDCAFCPNDPTQARSYPREEPVPMRGSANDFDVVRQAHSRMSVLKANHHPIDKIEWLILGGTWSSFPHEYRKYYHCSLLFAANLWSEGINVCQIVNQLNKPITLLKYLINKFKPKRTEWRDCVREMKSIEEEMEINKTSTCRVIGVTIETRPDEINLNELYFMRTLGITRIQMGFQHTNNKVLKKNNRGCSIEKCKSGLKIALENGFKVDGHWMPDLPGSNIALDYEMITKAFTDEDLRCDQIKLYPCQVLKYTKIAQWYNDKTYIPYSETNFDQLFELIIYAKSIIPKWVRTNRIVRDFPLKIIKGGLKVTHLNDLILQELKRRNIKCKCIRCNEVKRSIVDYNKAELLSCEYKSAGGIEYFISVEAEDKLLGFCRLRLNPSGVKHIHSMLDSAAIIRELHVYGITTSKGCEFTQHRGFGKQLVAKAESIAKQNNFKKMAIIAGVGVKKYYEQLGYTDESLYMIKQLN